MIELPAMSAFEQVRAEAYPGRELAAIPVFGNYRVSATQGSLIPVRIDHCFKRYALPSKSGAGV